MNEIKVRYVLDDGSVIEKYIKDNHKLYYIDLNFIALYQCPIDTDYVKSIIIRIDKDVEK